METEARVLVPEKSQNLIQEALDYINDIELIVIKVDDQYQNAVESCKEIKRFTKLLDDEKKNLAGEYYRPYKEILAKFKTPIDTLLGGERKFKAAMSVYAQEKQRKQIEEQRKLDVIADGERRKAEETASKEAEKVQEYLGANRFNMADKAEVRMETALQESVETVAPVVEDTTKAQGLSFRTDYECVEGDKKAAILFMAEDANFIHHLDINLKALNKIAKSFKGNLKIPGIRVYEKKTPIVRT